MQDFVHQPNHKSGFRIAVLVDYTLTGNLVSTGTLKDGSKGFLLYLEAHTLPLF